MILLCLFSGKSLKSVFFRVRGAKESYLNPKVQQMSGTNVIIDKTDKMTKIRYDSSEVLTVLTKINIINDPFMTRGWEHLLKTRAVGTPLFDDHPCTSVTDGSKSACHFQIGTLTSHS